MSTPVKQEEQKEKVVRMCFYCYTKEIEFKVQPCGCKTMCRGCGMKYGTGGYCKLCKEMFVGVRRIIPDEY